MRGRDPDQAWFWEPSWQEGERQASDDIAAGRLSRVCTDIDEMFAGLDAGTDP